MARLSAARCTGVCVIRTQIAVALYYTADRQIQMGPALGRCRRGVCERYDFRR